jgi:hypothetical protein
MDIKAKHLNLKAQKVSRYYTSVGVDAKPIIEHQWQEIKRLCQGSGLLRK